MLSELEFHVLRMLPGQMICHACIMQLAAELPEDIDTTLSESPGSYQHGAGQCSVCAQFSPIVVFTPRDPAVNAAEIGLG